MTTTEVQLDRMHGRAMQKKPSEVLEVLAALVVAAWLVGGLLVAWFVAE